MGDYLSITDTTPRAVETNNLTIKKAPLYILSNLITEAKAQQVDPNAVLAQAWKETGFGTIARPGLPTNIGTKAAYGNPMQYNAYDMKFDDPRVYRLPSSVRNTISSRIFNSIVDDRIKRDTAYKDASRRGYDLDLQSKADPSNDVIKGNIEFNKDIENRVKRNLFQNAHITGGVNYLKNMVADSNGNLQGGFEKYRGIGAAAKYHGRHVSELYDAVKNNTDIQKLIREVGSERPSVKYGSDWHENLKKSDQPLEGGLF